MTSQTHLTSKAEHNIHKEQQISEKTKQLYKKYYKSNLRSSRSKDLMPFCFCTQTQCDRERHGEQEDDEDLDVTLFFCAEQRNDGRHEQHDGQEGDDEPGEDVDAFLGVEAHELVGCAAAVALGDEQALKEEVSTRVYAMTKP